MQNIAAGALGAASATAQHPQAWAAVTRLALFGLTIGLVGLGALMLWTVLRWMRRRAVARQRSRSRGASEPGAWVQSGQRVRNNPSPMPWPSIPNPNLRDPIVRMLEAEDDGLDETTPLHASTGLDDTEDIVGDLHDTSEDDRWEFEEGAGSDGASGDDDISHDTNHDTNDLTKHDPRDDEEDAGRNDETQGFDGDAIDDPDDPDDSDDGSDHSPRERWSW